MAQSRGDISELPDKAAVRHSILNTIRAFNVKFKDEFGTLVCAADAADPWRRDIFPNYKHQRRKGRVESKIDWSGVFGIMSEIREELTKNMPYKILHVEKCEADDIIATLCAQQTEDLYLIVSGDKDFIQLQFYKGVDQYAPIQKKMVGWDSEAEGIRIDPKEFLLEQIMKGDRSDGIPNILSDDDVFVTGEKQKPMTKKRIQDMGSLRSIDRQIQANIDRNVSLIDLTKIPQAYEDAIINSYRSYKVNDRSKLLTYFIENKLKSLMENIGDF